jgi:hypothetical protein
MKDRIAIKYMGFWDVPRVFITRYRGQTFLFESAFDEALDDYPDSYKLYLLPDITDDDLPKDWTTLAAKATRFVTEVPIDRVQFDSTKRKTIDAAILDDVAEQISDECRHE